MISSLNSKSNLPNLNSDQDAILKKILFLNQTFSVIAGPEGKGDKIYSELDSMIFYYDAISPSKDYFHAG